MNFNDNNATDDSDDSFDSIFERFERQFANDDAHRIENEFEHQRNLRHEILAKLICLEIDLRNKANHPLDRFEYIERFPGFEREIKDAFRNVREIDVVFSTISQTHIDTDKGMLSLDGGTVDIPESLGHYEIQEKLGAGSFGVVFRAVDSSSGQTVALKFPRRRVLESREELNRFLEEAAAARGLDHPGIVRTHGVEQIEGFVFIVQQFVDGTDLTSLEESETSFKQVVEILARISDAVAYAHQNGYVHRDLKPANILLDRTGNPYIADFGLAIHESAQRMLKGQRCGSVAYMSPELVQGLSHRLDSRSDIWSLGVIMYQLLSGRRPFGGDTRDEIFDEIKTLDVRPLRMLDPEIDIELQRICLRCLNKRILERYPTADELAEDLRCWLSQPVHPRVPAPIVPKGLRSYGAEDAEFFLQLLPGPTDRNGFPESIRFWKTRIESTDSQVGFPLGVIFGPSGCGKSSFIKAGLLPSLDRRTVKPIYIESTSADTEVRLIKSLRAEFSEIPERISLPQLFHSIKEQLWSPRDKKVLIVLDQFEQWLYAADKQQESQLMEALRHCDGTTLQCIVTVRDDFWVKISTFMNELDISLNEGENVRRLDRFTMKHARKILAEFGRAYDCLPHDLTELTNEQNAFLDEAIGQLAEDDRVISVRLALTAEMFKNRNWTRAELKRVGGVSGIGERFLQETFESKDASPEYSVHNRAAQAVLESLLPPTGTDIRGHMRSRDELLTASTYESQPEKFDTLIHILNHDLRLTTPTDPDIVSAEAEVPASKGQFFQLTHDYLVPSIRGWLSSSKRQSWQGRANLRLTELAEKYVREQDTKFLPSFGEYVWIQSGVSNRKRTSAQKELMRKASILHGIRTAIFLIVAFLIYGVFAFVIYDNRNSAALAAMNKYLDGPSYSAERDLDAITKYQRYLKSPLANAFASNVRRRRLRAGVALNQLYGAHSATISQMTDDYLDLPKSKLDIFEFENIRQGFQSGSKSAIDNLFAKFEKNNSIVPWTFCPALLNQEEVRRELNDRLARLALASLAIGDRRAAETLLANVKDPTATTTLTHSIPELWPDLISLANIAEQIITDGRPFEAQIRDQQIETCPGNSLLFLLIIAAAQIDESSISETVDQRWRDMVSKQYVHNPSSGIHGACIYFANAWDFELPALAATGTAGGKNWWIVEVVPGIEMTFIKVNAGEFYRGAGSPPSPGQNELEQTLVKITEDYWLAATEVPFELIRKWALSENGSEIRKRIVQTKAKRFAPLWNAKSTDLPAFAISLNESIGLVDWINEKTSQRKSNQLVRTTFSVPTSDDWEFACRAGSFTTFHWGDLTLADLLKSYAVYTDYRFESEAKMIASPGQRIPNRWGFLDITGNVSELTFVSDAETSRGFQRGGHARYYQTCCSGWLWPIGKDNNLGLWGLRLKMMLNPE